MSAPRAGGGAAGGAWRCFVGLPLPAAWRGPLAAVTRTLSSRLASRISWTRPENAHLTLKFLGDVAPDRIPALEGALAAVPFAAFDLAAGGSGFFPPRGAPRVLWLGLSSGAEETARLAAGVDAVLAPLGFAPEGRPFTAHVTLGRVRRAARDEDWGRVAAAVCCGTFAPGRAERMVLWRSVPGPSGPRYDALREFPG